MAATGYEFWDADNVIAIVCLGVFNLDRLAKRLLAYGIVLVRYAYYLHVR